MKNVNKFSGKQKSQIRHWKKKTKSIALYKRLQVFDYAAKGHTNQQKVKLTCATSRKDTMRSEVKKLLIQHFMTF